MWLWGTAPTLPSWLRARTWCQTSTKFLRRWRASVMWVKRTDRKMQNRTALLHRSSRMWQFSNLLMKAWSDCPRLVEKSAQGLWWLRLSVAESSQWWVEGLHRKGHHRCCQCRHRRIWPCECNLRKRCIFDAFYCKLYIFVVTDIHSCPVQPQSYLNWPWIDLNCRAPWWWLRPWSLTQRGDLVCGLCQILMERTSPKPWHS